MKINVSFAGNDRMFPGLLMALTSIWKNTSRPVDAYILTGDFSDLDPRYRPFSPEMISFLKKVGQAYHPENDIYVVDMTHLKREIYHCKGVKGRFSVYAFLRLYYDMLDGLPERLLYLDIDTLCVKDISSLYDTDLQGHSIGAILDPVATKWISPVYCNSGVLLLDMKKLQTNGRLAKCRKMVERRWMFMPDQSAINKWFKHDILRLEGKYNEQVRLQEGTVIRHYCAVFKVFPYMHFIKAKPWDELSKFHKERKEYELDSFLLYCRNLLECYRKGEDPKIEK